MHMHATYGESVMRVYLRIYYACHEHKYIIHIYVIYLDTPVCILLIIILSSAARIFFIRVTVSLACAYITRILRVYLLRVLDITSAHTLHGYYVCTYSYM